MLIVLLLFVLACLAAGIVLVVCARPLLAWFMSPARPWRRGPHYCYDEAKKLYYVEASPDAMRWPSRLGYTCDLARGRIYITPGRVQVLFIRLTGLLLAVSSAFILVVLVYLWLQPNQA
ncbi:MAG: hypothetical protein HY673_14110 [Chloroflexi bacterium]|nr:hypothetical protein [Chloroflexota bacterium]